LKSLKWRIVIVVALFIIALWTLYPTYRYYSMSQSQLETLPKAEREILKKKSLNLGLDLQGGMYLLYEVDRSKLKPEEVKGAVDRAIEVIRNRIDQWGVFEPSIEKLGEDRILVQLPGVLDRERARSLIGRTALLEFKLVAKTSLVNDIIKKIDDKLHEIELSKLPADSDTLALDPNPFLNLLGRIGADVIAVPEENVKKVEEILNMDEIKALVPKSYEFLFGKPLEREGRKYRPLYLVKKDPVLTGAYLTDARPDIYRGGEARLQNTPVVSITFDRKGAARFAAVTGQHVGEKLAIVLDSVVQSAPVIQERISGGRAMITGLDSMDEAKDLAIVLRAGALPAPLKRLEERSVGPLLGKDSISKGITALIIGFLAVVLFMVFYYRGAGLIADLALILNLVFVLALLAGFHATLTLPGLAGLILTVGMSVDANVLIFERIREELGLGKTPKVAIATGYSRALITILDANLTTLIAALVLLRFGTGPIKGFAVVLSLGILVSFFTAIFVTRIIFDYLIFVKRIKKVSI